VKTEQNLNYLLLEIWLKATVDRQLKFVPKIITVKCLIDTGLLLEFDILPTCQTRFDICFWAFFGKSIISFVKFMKSFII
jgi:hypothetical protein